MISVIVPVYNVEPYLKKCLDSIVNQTYRNLEILLVDDGSTDKSGEICDRFAEVDRRIRVFHTENRGLSCARNTGLDHAAGEWIGFVDSDDWIEPDMYETLLKRAEATGADIVECGSFWEYRDGTKERIRRDAEMSGKEALTALLHGKLGNAIWDKLYKSSCYHGVRFPKDRVYEDIATTYKLFFEARCVCTVSASKYHYLKRDDSLSGRKTVKNRVGYWRSHRERFEALNEQRDEAERRLLIRFCARAAARMWADYARFSPEEREACGDTAREIHAFTKRYIPLFGDKDWNLRLRIGVFFPHFYSHLSFRTAWLVNAIRILAEKARQKAANLRRGSGTEGSA